MPKLIQIPALILTLFLLSGCSQNNATPSAQGEESCASCHNELVTGFEATVHAQADVTCTDCHDNIEAHLQNASNLPQIDVRGQTCAACHGEEYTQWEASPHAQIPLDEFPDDPRVMECMKCHQASGFAAVIESGEDFKSAWGPKPTSEPEPVTCMACHSPHNPRDDKMLRLSKGELCATCHDTKWQNLVLTGTHPESTLDYSAFAHHPHNTEEGCALCHMATTPGADNVGGHTFTMRPAEDGKLNLRACASCHDNPDTYNIGGKQTEVEETLNDLRSALKERNSGELPGNEPGSCNQCHRGGTLPFDNDPDLILEKAYENYQLIDRDKSLGVHNPDYALQL
ncbi:cytochrome c3 family protein, partial [Dethiobacter alkaliphilus]|uniref:cytochrome c3 family protein n=1 Tax=Dethiobacter alkaliphilus TaxID=427926 RepID=UPI00222654FB